MIIISSAEMAPSGKFHEDYLSPDKTSSIKGIFVLLVIFSHGKNYLRAVGIGGVYDDPYLALQNHMDQLIVAMFFFYSGYGMMEQIKKRGYIYAQNTVRRKLPQLLVNFDFAVLLYLFVNIIRGKYFTIKHILLSLIAIQSLGNSNWYICIFFILYILCFLAFLPLRSKAAENRGALFVCLCILTVLSVSLIFALISLHQPKYWYNTLILFAGGFWYSFFQPFIEKILMRKDIVYYSVAAAVFCVYVFAYGKRWTGIEFYTVWAVCFTMLIVLFTMKVTIASPFLSLLGRHVFSIYIIQHLPMMLLFSMPFFQSHKYWFLSCSYLIIIPLAIAFEYATEKLDRMLWREKRISNN